jgi:reticulon-4-interacting protein 1, mitochondrial
LNWISQAASDGRIQPVIDEVFPFAKLPDAFEKVSQMHGKGKTIIDFGSIQST